MSVTNSQSLNLMSLKNVNKSLLNSSSGAIDFNNIS